jgi:hypothetical protein
MLRSLLIILIVFLLSGLHWSSTSGDTKWMLVEKGFEADNQVVQMIDSLEKEGYEIRAFEKDFPLLNDSIIVRPGNYWELIEDLTQRSIGSIVIVSASRAEAFRGMSVPLPGNIKWISKELPAKEVMLFAEPSGDGNSWIRKGKFTSQLSEFATSIERSSTPSDSVKTLSVNIVASKGFEYDARILTAALKAVDESVPSKINMKVVESPSPNSDWKIILSDQRAVEAGNVIHFKKVNSDRLLVQEKSNQWILTKRLTPDNAIDGQLALQLASILFPQKEAWRKASANDIRMVDDRMVSEESGSSPDENKLAKADTAPLWAILLLLTLIAERSIAWRKQQ